MKYLVISKPRRNRGEGFSTQAESLHQFAVSLRYSLESGRLEGAWAVPGGGHALIIDADTDYDIASEIRMNPLCRDGDNELIPVEDLMGPLRQEIQRAGGHQQEKALSDLFRNSLFSWNVRQRGPVSKQNH